MREPQRIIGNSDHLNQAMAHISRLALINRPVLVIGERGTGKELAAERLHFLSTRWDQPLLKVNCAAISDQLLESELFGHEPGAFTGANRTHHGRFERADGGTLFLDELATMSTRLQEKLLRLVEYGEFERLGGQETLQVDVRVLAATHANLPALARRGEFREDLLDRLSFDVVHLPPLRHRKDDIDELANQFAIQMSSDLGWELFPGFSATAMEQLHRHDWPGNVRELKNAVERSLYRWARSDLPVGEIITDPFASPFAPAQPGTDTNAETTSSRTEPRETKPAGLTKLVNQYEKKLVEAALEDQRGHQGRSAEHLGLSYDQLRGLLRKHGINSRRWRN